MSMSRASRKQDWLTRTMASATCSSAASKRLPPKRSTGPWHAQPAGHEGAGDDLRGNPGGLLNVAVEIAERFIDSGLIVSTRGRAQGQTQSLPPTARPGGECRCMSWSTTTAPAPARSWREHSKITAGPRSRGPHLWQRVGTEHILAALGTGGPETHDGEVLLATQQALQRAGRRARHPGHASCRRQTRRQWLDSARGINHRRPAVRYGPCRSDPDGQEPAPRDSLSNAEFPRSGLTKGRRPSQAAVAGKRGRLRRGLAGVAPA